MPQPQRDNTNAEKLLKRIDADIMAENIWRLVQVPSPTGNERAAAMLFAELLTQAGAEVRIDETISQSPNVIGVLKGSRKGKVLQLAGHLDHIDMAHESPSRQGGIISGRGSADMKNGLAGIIEIVRILKESGCDFPGEILVTAYGLHEAPVGDSRGLLNLISDGVTGDAAIVFEGPDDFAAVTANGMAIWDMMIKGGFDVCHELCLESDPDDILTASMKVVEALKQEDRKLIRDNNPFELLRRESLFIGQMHYGDFYNRVPNVVRMQGTRRWHPDKNFDSIRAGFDSLLNSIGIPASVGIEIEWMLVGDSYEIPKDESIVTSLTDAYENIYGQTCPVRGHSSVTDVCRLVRHGGIPAVLCGFGTSTGHADYEYVSIEQVKKSCQVALLTAIKYLKSTSEK